MYEEDVGRATLTLSPYGAKMDSISKSKIPLSHKAGNIYKIQYLTYWNEEQGSDASQRHVSWTRELYAYMTLCVSKNPRTTLCEL